MYDNTNASPTNRVTLTGRISSEPRDIRMKFTARRFTNFRWKSND